MLRGVPGPSVPAARGGPRAQTFSECPFLCPPSLPPPPSSLPALNRYVLTAYLLTINKTDTVPAPTKQKGGKTENQ